MHWLSGVCRPLQFFVGCSYCLLCLNRTVWCFCGPYPNCLYRMVCCPYSHSLFRTICCLLWSIPLLFVRNSLMLCVCAREGAGGVPYPHCLCGTVCFSDVCFPPCRCLCMVCATMWCLFSSLQVSVSPSDVCFPPYRCLCMVCATM